MQASSSSSAPPFVSSFSTTPAPKTFLQKVRVLQELKRKFESKTCSASEMEHRISDCATTKMLKIINTPYDKLIENKFRSSNLCCSLSDLKLLTETLIENECAHPEAIVAYHGNKSSLVPDIFGLLVDSLNIEKTGDHRPVPRLFPHHFESNVQNFLTVHQCINDHSDFFRETLVSASPTLFSHFSDRRIENALVFYAFGTSVAPHSACSKICDLFLHCDFKDKGLEKIIIKNIVKIENDFPQSGFIHQIFFNNSDIANRYTYPSFPQGEPLKDILECSATTKEFLSVLNSQDTHKRKEFTRKYGVLFTNVQLRILAHPKIFYDKNLTKTHCYRKIKFDENLYYQRIQSDIIDPIMEAWIEGGRLNGSFAFSSLTRIAGLERSPVARLADYVYTDMSNPVSSIIYGDEEAVIKALANQEITPLTTFGNRVTLLELSMITGQINIFNILLEEFKKINFQPMESFVSKLLVSSLKNNFIVDRLWLLNNIYNLYSLELVIVCSVNKKDREFVFATLKRMMEIGKTNPTDLISEVLISYCLRSFDLEMLEFFISNFHEIQKMKEVSKWIIAYVSPFQFIEVISLFEKHGFDLVELEEAVLNKANSMPSSYRSFYESLSPDEQLRLPLARWWKFQFENFN